MCGAKLVQYLKSCRGGWFWSISWSCQW